MTKTKESLARNVEVRRLLAEGKSPAQVASLMGITTNAVYSVRSYDKLKAQKARITPVSTDTTPTPRKVGRPKGSRTKPKMVVYRDVFNAMKQELITLRTENIRLTVDAVKVCPPPVYVEVPVPQPFSHYSFWQRLGILFLGRAA